MEGALKSIIIPAFASLLLFSTSCSWYREMERDLVEDNEKQQKKKRPVTRQQYDQLLTKYEELSRKYEALKENPNAGQSSLVDDLQKASAENFAGNVETETVDLFAQGSANNSVIQAPSDLGSQVELYRKGISLKASNSGEATKIFQQLETSSDPSVAARAKFQVGEIMFSKQQYDVALQMFEDIISKYAQSGVVLDALKFAVSCSDKLGLKPKKDQYSSMLADVFEAN